MTRRVSLTLMHELDTAAVREQATHRERVLSHGSHIIAALYTDGH